jgi:hypothetical protein
MAHKGGFKNLKLGKNVYRQMKRRSAPENPLPRHQPSHPKDPNRLPVSRFPLEK